MSLDDFRQHGSDAGFKFVELTDSLPIVSAGSPLDPVQSQPSQQIAATAPPAHNPFDWIPVCRRRHTTRPAGLCEISFNCMLLLDLGVPDEQVLNIFQAGMELAPDVATGPLAERPAAVAQESG